MTPVHIAIVLILILVLAGCTGGYAPPVLRPLCRPLRHHPDLPPGRSGASAMTRFKVTVYDLAEGVLVFELDAENPDAAADEAAIAAAERGCRHVDEIITEEKETQ